MTSPPATLKVLTLVINLAVVAYLLISKRLFGLGGPVGFGLLLLPDLAGK